MEINNRCKPPKVVDTTPAAPTFDPKMLEWLVDSVELINENDMEKIVFKSKDAIIWEIPMSFFQRAEIKAWENFIINHNLLKNFVHVSIYKDDSEQVLGRVINLSATSLLISVSVSGTYNIYIS